MTPLASILLKRHHGITSGLLTMKYFNTFYVCSAWHRACSYGRMGLEEV